MVGAVGIEVASLNYKSFKANGVAPPPCSNWSLMEPNLCIEHDNLTWTVFCNDQRQNNWFEPAASPLVLEGWKAEALVASQIPVESRMAPGDNRNLTFLRLTLFLHELYSAIAGLSPIRSVG
jgi:hypothetical protein